MGKQEDDTCCSDTTSNLGKKKQKRQTETKCKEWKACESLVIFLAKNTDDFNNSSVSTLKSTFLFDSTVRTIGRKWFLCTEKKHDTEQKTLKSLRRIPIPGIVYNKGVVAGDDARGSGLLDEGKEFLLLFRGRGSFHKASYLQIGNKALHSVSHLGPACDQSTNDSQLV